VRGNKMEERVAQMERERDQLVRDIRAGESRVQALETQLRSVEGATEADRRAQRELLEQKLREEQEALKRLQERLNARKPPQ
jgi:chromosome segregation ATPase